MTDHDDFDPDDEIGEKETHPRFRERRAEVADQSLRLRNRKLIALGVVLLLILLAGASTQSALFDVDEVRIVGAQRTSPEYLRTVADIELGAPLLGLDTDTAIERLVALPEVETATATTSWRGAVTIEINERLPVARIESPEGVIVVAADGIVLEIIAVAEDDLTPDDLTEDGSTEENSTGDSSSEDELVVALDPAQSALLETLPEIGGAMFSTQVGNQVPDVLTDALEVAASLPSDIEAITERVEITVDSLVLRVVGGGSISLGDARDLESKFVAVRAFLAEVDLSCLDTLNVQAPTVPVIVRSVGC